MYLHNAHKPWRVATATLRIIICRTGNFRKGKLSAIFLPPELRPHIRSKASFNENYISLSDIKYNIVMQMKPFRW